MLVRFQSGAPRYMKVVNKYKEKYTHYIGRRSVFGNPFVIDEDGTRAEVIEKYEEYARGNLKLRGVIRDLPESAVLGCFCKPKKCHGDVILKIWEEYNPPMV